MSLPGLVLSYACCWLRKVHARTSARRAPDTCIPPHPSPFGRDLAVKPPPYSIPFQHEPVASSWSCAMVPASPRFPGISFAPLMLCQLPAGQSEGTACSPWPAAPSLCAWGEALGRLPTGPTEMELQSCRHLLQAASPLWTQLPEALTENTQCKQL